MSRLLLALAALVLCHAVAAQAWSLSSGGDWSDWGDSSLWGGSDYSSSSSWSSSSWSSGGSSWSSSSWSSGGSSWSSDSFWGSSGSSWSSSSWSSGGSSWSSWSSGGSSWSSWSSGGSSWSSDSFWGSSGSSSWSSSSWSSGGSSWSSSDDDDDSSSSWSSGGWSGGGWSSAWSSSSYASWSSSSLWSSSSGGSSWSTSSWSSGGSSLWSSTSGGSSSSWSTDSFWGSSSGASFWSGGGSSSDGNSGSSINFDDLWDAVPSYSTPTLGDDWGTSWGFDDGVFTPSYINTYTPTLGDDWGTDLWSPTTYTPIYSWDGGDDAQTYTNPWNPSYTGGGGDTAWVDPWTSVDSPSDLFGAYTPNGYTPTYTGSGNYDYLDWGNYGANSYTGGGGNYLPTLDDNGLLGGGSDHGDSNMPGDINWDFISQVEGGRLTTGIWDGEPGSGITIGTAFDLGARDVNDLRVLNLDQTLIDKLTPYLGMQGETTADLGDIAANLHITAAEANAIDAAVRSHETDVLIERYNNVVGPGAFEALPQETQTVIASVHYQYGNLATRTPSFWAAATANNVDGMIAELRDFHDNYPTRRNTEADLLSGVQ